jgi:4-aminobutyrate aminotransferase
MVVAKKALMSQWKKGAHGNTYGGNPIAAASALATLNLIEQGLADNAATVGAYFMERLRELQSRHACIGEVRGKGLMIGCEFVKPDGTAAAKLCDDIIVRAYHHGMLLLPCGLSTVRFMPPLVITTDEVDEAIEMLDAAILEAEQM